MPSAPLLHLHPAVQAALAEGRPVVALESAVISHGLPWPDNVALARDMEAVVRAGGAEPASAHLPPSPRERGKLERAGTRPAPTDFWPL